MFPGFFRARGSAVRLRKERGTRRACAYRGRKWEKVGNLIIIKFLMGNLIIIKFLTRVKIFDAF